MACRSLSRIYLRVNSRTQRTSIRIGSLYLPRYYATHRDTPSSLLAQQLGRTSGSPNNLGGTGSSGDSVGPFPLGVQPLNLGRTREKVTPWNELTPSGKVLRTTARATNFTVILLGAGLSTVLVYALATELFAKNSPTVLYGDACDRIRASSAVIAHLPPPLSFHTTPPSPLPPRHRNRHPQSHLAVDSKGVEHLLLHFWITSSHSKDVHPPTSTWWEWFTGDWDWEWNRARIEENATFLKARMREIWEETKQAAAFVSGMQVPSSPSSSTPNNLPTWTTETDPNASKDKSGWSFLGLFKDVRLGGRGSSRANGGATVSNAHWDSAEVHIDLVKDEKGIFQYRYLLVDIPDSRVRRPIRIMVEKGHGFNERDGVFLWQ
ncbi:hypothetical protein BS47DRAFT_1481719 [Hydnum rufescens UP504]|uniref:Mitochondrial import inner membrane translocase subunit Tim21 n=1 Tax=Hydnum rufescens UP504 TaxID=1448309 RepID=A0A9P6B8R3_9AGAM|nr:hypothetical protein BS47DRAFT_1481719 [Hydnum rufescens UP504]